MEETITHRICLRDFRHTKPLKDSNKILIAEALLCICGLQKIWDSPDGRRVFTVAVIPDNVPIADIYWEEFEREYRRDNHAS